VEGGSCCFGQVAEHYFVAVCTPLMTRVHKKVPKSSEVLLVDASGGMDRQKPQLLQVGCHWVQSWQTVSDKIFLVKL